jgi:pyruvate dehydrogenase E2 component (dihydrolipoamide acetyltransferase)
MPTNVIMPALGVAQQTGKLLRWFKAEGQTITKGEPLMEIETDKATVEIEAPASGTLAGVIAAPGDEMPVGERIALILAPGEEAFEHRHAQLASGTSSSSLATTERNQAARRAPQTNTTSEARPTTEKEQKVESYSAIQTPRQSAVAAAQTRYFAARVLASPKARRIAREQGVDLAMVRGSGPEGSVLAEDVVRAARGGLAAASGGAQQLIPLTPMRRVIGQRMTQSKQSAPHFYLSMDIDMSAITKVREDWSQPDSKRRPSINDFVLFACARALRDFPSINASYTDGGIRLHAEINIGMAVALDDGLVVPVIRNADRLGLTALSQQTRELTDRAQSKKLLPPDYENGTFTVSNLGMLGVDSFIAIINPPQCAILAAGRVARRVIADDVGIMIRPMMSATLSADHRIVDGAVAARFLQTVKHALENPSV